MVPVRPDCGSVTGTGAPPRDLAHSGAWVPAKRRTFSSAVVPGAAVRRASAMARSMTLSRARGPSGVGCRSLQSALTTQPDTADASAGPGGPSRVRRPARGRFKPGTGVVVPGAGAAGAGRRGGVVRPAWRVVPPPSATTTTTTAAATVAATRVAVATTARLRRGDEDEFVVIEVRPRPRRHGDGRR